MLLGHESILLLCFSVSFLSSRLLPSCQVALLYCTASLLFHHRASNSGTLLLRFDLFQYFDEVLFPMSQKELPAGQSSALPTRGHEIMVISAILYIILFCMAGVLIYTKIFLRCSLNSNGVLALLAMVRSPSSTLTTISSSSSES